MGRCPPPPGNHGSATDSRRASAPPSAFKLRKGTMGFDCFVHTEWRLQWRLKIAMGPIPSVIADTDDSLWTWLKKESFSRWLVLALAFGRWWKGPTNYHFALKWMQLKWWGHLNPTSWLKRNWTLCTLRQMGREHFCNLTKLPGASAPNILHWPSLETITVRRLAKATFFMIEIETGVTFFDCKALLASFWTCHVTNVNNSDCQNNGQTTE